MKTFRRTHASIVDLDPYSGSARTLLEASDAYLGALYPPESNHLTSPDDLAQAHVRFLGYQVGLDVVGCGAVKILEDSTGRYGEIKRVFVLPDFRGRGISKALMEALEAHLIDQEVNLSRLETGIHQPEALGLYRRFGYVERGPYGNYVPDPLSVFMEKNLIF
jgi:putative acetyltransferase